MIIIIMIEPLYYYHCPPHYDHYSSLQLGIMIVEISTCHLQ